MGSITSFSKQVIVFVLALTLITRPVFAATVGGWTLGGGVAQGASTVYTGTKNLVINGVDYIKKGTAIVTPTATGVAKVLARGAAGYALSVAVEQILGAVDWVLDPENNRIKYFPAGEFPPDPTYQWLWNGALYNSAQEACRAYWSSIGSGWVFHSVDQPYRPYPACFGYNAEQNRYDAYQPVQRVPRVEAVPEQEEKYLPLPVVAQKVISNAESGDTNAQVATGAAAADIVAEAEKDDAKARPIAQQLEASSTTKPADEAAADKANEATGEQTKNPDKPDTTDLKLTFPIFCNWAPTVCEAAQTVISFPKTLTNWWETGKEKAEGWATSISESWAKVKEEYANKPQENTDTELELPEPDQPDINTDISFGGSCPASRSVPVSFAGIHTEIEFSFQWFCEIASIAKPVVISISAFAAALIVAGVRTEDD